MIRFVIEFGEVRILYTDLSLQETLAYAAQTYSKHLS